MALSDQKIQDLIDDGYSFTAMDYIREAWAIFKKHAGSFIGFFIVFLFLTMFVSFIPFIGPIANYLVISPVGTVGFYIVAYMIQRKENFSFGDFFKGFEYVGPLMLMSLVLYGIYILVFSPTIISLYRSGVLEWYQNLLSDPMSGMDEMPPFTANNGIMLALNILPLLYFHVAYMWAPHFIVFQKKGFWDGLETSRKLITRQWFSVFRLMLAWMGIFIAITLVMGLLVGLGAVTSMFLSGFLIFALVVAMFCVLPVVFISYYTAFANVTGLLTEDEEKSDILDHLVD